MKSDISEVNYNMKKIMLPTKQTSTKEASVECIGIGGNITGSHYDLILCDDIVTEKDRYSRAERERTKNFLRELQNIKKANGRIIYTGTPWHKDDAFSILPVADKYPIGTTGVFSLDDENMKKIRQGTTASLFAANYLLKHIADENKIIGEPKYKPWLDADCVGQIDPAYYGKNCTAFTLAQRHGEGVTVRGWVWRKDITELYSEIAALAQRYRCGTIHVERNADKGLSIKGLGAYHKALAGYDERQNKHYKIIQYVKANYDRIYFAEDCDPAYLEQVVDYAELQEPDDAPDSLAALLRESGVLLSGSTVAAAGELGYEFKY